MKKSNLLGMLLAVLCLAAGCTAPAEKTNETSVSSAVEISESSLRAASSSLQSAETRSEPSTSTTTESSATVSLWNNEKKQELARFMDSWGTLMGQSYTAYFPGKDVNFYGFEFPTPLTENALTMTIAYQNEPIDIQWSETGEEPDRYNLVAVYSDIAAGSMFNNHLYLFTIYNGQPLVLITMQNQGNDNSYLYFNQTENTDLANGFAQIVNQ